MRKNWSFKSNSAEKFESERSLIIFEQDLDKENNSRTGNMEVSI